MKRTLRDILIGIVLGVLIVFSIWQLIPDAKEILEESFLNLKEDVSLWISDESSVDDGEIDVDGEEVDEEDTTDSGITGEGYSFSETMNPYYALLRDDEKSLYAQMYANLEALETSFVPCTTVSSESIELVFQSVIYDHPDLFWVDNSYSYKYVESGEIVEIDLKYNETINSFDASKEAFDNACNEIIWNAKQYTSEIEQERYVHDALIQMIDYDVNASLNQSAYSAMVNHQTVCAGYAKSFQYIMNQLGYPCYYVVGTSQDEDHAWNMIYIDGTWKNVDLTWDDAQTYDHYMFFNLSDEELSDTHVRAQISTYLPICY